ncbi:Epsin-4 [Nakaseomyces bracarensis]|uniref:Epsin-4 n=1 Tax=Nakaseomyces bracarensis TaxID=273131 RepID=A0ABR4P0K5_9SACH
MALIRTMKSLVQSSTEMKVKEATNSSTKTGATGSVMNEMSILTFSPQTLDEITNVVRKRLSNRKPSQTNSIHILKTLTLVSYLLNHSSHYFIAWIKDNEQLVQPYTAYTAHAASEKRQEEIRQLAHTVLQLLRDDELLERRRSEVVEFRSSISTPGRISTDNSHVRRQQLLEEFSATAAPLERPQFHERRVVSDRAPFPNRRLTTLLE